MICTCPPTVDLPDLISSSPGVQYVIGTFLDLLKKLRPEICRYDEDEATIRITADERKVDIRLVSEAREIAVSATVDGVDGAVELTYTDRLRSETDDTRERVIWEKTEPIKLAIYDATLQIGKRIEKKTAKELLEEYGLKEAFGDVEADWHQHYVVEYATVQMRYDKVAYTDAVLPLVAAIAAWALKQSYLFEPY